MSGEDVPGSDPISLEAKIEEINLACSSVNVMSTLQWT